MSGFSRSGCQRFSGSLGIIVERNPKVDGIVGKVYYQRKWFNMQCVSTYQAVPLSQPSTQQAPVVGGMVDPTTFNNNSARWWFIIRSREINSILWVSVWKKKIISAKCYLPFFWDCLFNLSKVFEFRKRTSWRLVVVLIWMLFTLIGV